MPLQRCQVDGKRGWKWGDSGKCYTGPGAKEKASRQGRAIEANKSQAANEYLEKMKEAIQRHLDAMDD